MWRLRTNWISSLPAAAGLTALLCWLSLDVSGGVQSQRAGSVLRIMRRNGFGQLHGRQDVWNGDQLLEQTYYVRGVFREKFRFTGARVEHTYEDADYFLVTEIYENGELLLRTR